MNPFYFGPGDRPLFGVFSHGKSSANDGGSVLLCYPVGSEYMRAHRAFRQLNTLLNRAGMNVLRFDYSCTGDSSGAGVDATVEAWLDDISWAIDELKDNAASQTVTIVGLRWGATLAALACSERSDVDHLILWDPIASGSAYLDEHLGTPRPDGLVGLEGFPLSPELVRGLDSADLLDAIARPTSLEFSVLVAEDRPDYRTVEAGLRARDRGEHFEVVPTSGDWSQADPFGDALIPQKIMQSIVDRLLTMRTLT